MVLYFVDPFLINSALQLKRCIGLTCPQITNLQQTTLKTLRRKYGYFQKRVVFLTLTFKKKTFRYTTNMQQSTLKPSRLEYGKSLEIKV